MFDLKSLPEEMRGEVFKHVKGKHLLCRTLFRELRKNDDDILIFLEKKKLSTCLTVMMIDANRKVYKDLGIVSNCYPCDGGNHLDVNKIKCEVGEKCRGKLAIEVRVVFGNKLAFRKDCWIRAERLETYLHPSLNVARCGREFRSMKFEYAIAPSHEDDEKIRKKLQEVVRFCTSNIWPPCEGECTTFCKKMWDTYV